MKRSTASLFMLGFFLLVITLNLLNPGVSSLDKALSNTVDVMFSFASLTMVIMYFVNKNEESKE